MTMTERGTVAGRAGHRYGPAAADAVRVRDVVKRYAGGTALDGVDLDVARGELVAMLGPSGCGKTTMLRCIGGLESVDSGTIEIGGREMSTARNAVPPHRRGLGFMFQSYALWPHLTVRRNVEYGLRVAKVGRADRQRRVDESLELVGLAGQGHRHPYELSGGQQQRVALARSIVVRPAVLLMDEPLSNLDAALRDRMRTEIRHLVKDIGITCLYVTHDQREALAIADRVLLMANGRVAQHGTPDELYTRPVDSFVAGFIGAANILPLTARPAAGATGADTADLGVITGTVGPERPSVAEWAATFRPDDVVVGPAAAAEPERTNQWPGVVTERTYEGASSQLTVLVGRTTIQARVRDAGVRVGDQVLLHVPAERVLFVPLRTPGGPATAEPDGAAS
jgi:ABC-type Fe3+/spermidine/putrescine transport system ATPase subunit